MKLLGRDIPVRDLVIQIGDRLRVRGLPTSAPVEVPAEGVEPRVEPLTYNLNALEEHADPTRGLPLHTHRGGMGQLVLAAKWTFRKTAQVFINETLGRQRVFNGLVRDSYAQLSAEVIRLRREVEELKARGPVPAKPAPASASLSAQTAPREASRPAKEAPAASEGVPAERTSAAAKEAPATRPPPSSKEVPATRMPPSSKVASAGKPPQSSKEASATRPPQTSKEASAGKQPQSSKEAPATRPPQPSKEASAGKQPQSARGAPAAAGASTAKEAPAARSSTAPAQPLTAKDVPASARRHAPEASEPVLPKPRHARAEASRPTGAQAHTAPARHAGTGATPVEPPAPRQRPPGGKAPRRRKKR